MFKKEEIETYKKMKERMDEFETFFNEDYSKRLSVCLPTDYFGKKLLLRRIKSIDFTFVLYNNDFAPLLLINFSKNKIIQIEMNEALKEKAKKKTEITANSRKIYFNRKIKSIFSSKKKKLLYKEILECSNRIECINNELCANYNMISITSANLFMFSLQEFFEPEYIENINKNTIYARPDDLINTMNAVTDDEIHSNGIILDDVATYKFISLKEGEY